MILTQQLITNSSKYSARSALRYLGKEVSYQKLLETVARLSYLYQNELGANIRMAFVCRNSPAWIVTFFAMTNIRALSIPVNPDLPPDEMISWITDSQATHIAVTSDLLTHVKEILSTHHVSLPIIEIEKKKGGEYDTSFTPPSEQTPIENDPVLMLRTNGTTGKPKFVLFTHKQLSHASSAIKSHYHLGSTDRFHTSLNWFHPFAFIHSMLLPLMAGATCVIDHGLPVNEILDFLLDSKVTRLIDTPPHFLKLLMTCKNEKRVLPGVKSITVGIGSLSAELKKTFNLIQVQVSHCYGQTENLWTIAMQDTQNPGDPLTGYRKGFMGRGIAGLKYKVINLNGDEVEGKGQRSGQLALTGPTVMQAYFELEKETKQAIRGTWLYTGDMAQLEGEGDELTLTFIGRKEDLIMNGEVPISFYEIDKALRSCPYLQDAAAFTIKNIKNQMVVVCAAVKKPGLNVNEKQVLDHCITKLPSHLIPLGVAFTDLIPRDLGSNVNCTKLRGQFSGLVG